jgi:hypothetical protein
MLGNQEKLEILKKIIESPTFKDAARLRDLLSYLVKESIAGRKPKETTIAIDVLGKDKDFDPKDDAIVRVYINNLRTKLEHYYHMNPSGIQYRLTIPKGRYEIDFEPIEVPAEIVEPKKKKWHLVVIGVLSLIIIALLFLMFSKSTGTESTSKIISSVIGHEKKPIMIVVGDFFVMNEEKLEGGEHNNVRDFSINSLDDFMEKSKVDKNFQGKYSPALYTYLRPSTYWGLWQILSVLKGKDVPVSLKLASQFTEDEFKSNNVIFMGQIKSLFVLRKFLSLYGIKCDLNKNTLSIVSNDGKSEQLYSPADIHGGKFEKDFSFIVKGKGPGGTDFLLLMGCAEIGLLGAVKGVSDIATTNSILDKFSGGEVPENFMAVFESEGLNQTVFGSKMKNVIVPKINYPKKTDSLFKK